MPKSSGKSSTHTHTHTHTHTYLGILEVLEVSKLFGSSAADALKSRLGVDLLFH